MKLCHTANVFSSVVALSMLPVLVRSIDPNMKRVLNLAYGASGGPSITYYTQAQMYNYIKQIGPDTSAIANFMLNVKPARLYLYQPLLGNIVNVSKIPVYPAIGKPDLTQFEINDTYYKEMAQGYRSFTDCIQIDGPQMYSEPPFNVRSLYEMVDWLSGIGFKHIQMNTWPFRSDHITPYPFANPAVDSAMEQVQVAFTNPPENTRYNASDPDNWKINAKKITNILGFNSTIRIIINYENRPQEALLATFPTNQQLAAFQTTLDSISNTLGIQGRVHWTAPWSQNYNPIGNGTWNWILRQFANGNPP